MFAIQTGALLNASFGSSSIASDASVRTQGDRPWFNCPIDRLPREILVRIFMEVIVNDDCNFEWIGVLSTVCRRWYSVCNHTLLWDFVAKRIFVVYPFVMRLPHSTPWDPSSQEIVNKMRMFGAPEHSIVQHDRMLPLPAPTRHTLKRAFEKVKKYKERSAYYKFVQQRRSFVLHAFLSITLLSLTCAIFISLSLSEGYLSTTFNKNTVFFLLYVCYICIVGIIVSNVVMQAHFEPQPLLLRLTKNKILIIASAMSIILGVFDVIIPTALIQINLNKKERYSWIWCGATVIVSFCLWQGYVLMCLLPEAKHQFNLQMSSLNVKQGIQFILMNIPNAFPLFFAISAICGLHYLQYGSPAFVFISCVPTTIALAVLSFVCLLDFMSLYRTKDLVVGVCLFLAMLFPLSIMLWDFRGLNLLPLALSSLGFFCAHFWFALCPSWKNIRTAKTLESPAVEKKKK